MKNQMKQVSHLESEKIYLEIRAYAEEMGGSTEDIEPDWQAASYEVFSQENWLERKK